MISKYSHKGLNWIDLESPKEEEITFVLEEYAIPIFIKEEIILRPQEDVIRLDHNFIFISITLTGIFDQNNIYNKLIFVLSDNFLISIHDQPIKALDNFLKEMELDIISKEKFNINNNNLLFANLLKSLYLNSNNEIIKNEQKIKTLSEKIYRKNIKYRRLLFLLIFSFITIILLFFYAIKNI